MGGCRVLCQWIGDTCEINSRGNGFSYLGVVFLFCAHWCCRRCCFISFQSYLRCGVVSLAALRLVRELPRAPPAKPWPLLLPRVVWCQVAALSATVSTSSWRVQFWERICRFGQIVKLVPPSWRNNAGHCQNIWERQRRLGGHDPTHPCGPRARSCCPRAHSCLVRCVEEVLNILSKSVGVRASVHEECLWEDAKEFLWRGQVGEAFFDGHTFDVMAVGILPGSSW